MNAEDLLAVLDVLAESLPEFSGAVVVRPWALTAAAGAASATIGGHELHDSAESAARAVAEAIRGLEPLDRGNDAFAVVAVIVCLGLAGNDSSLDRAAALAGVRLPMR